MDNFYPEFGRNGNSQNYSNFSELNSNPGTVMPNKDFHFTPPKRRFKTYIYGEPPAKKPAPSIQLEAGFKWNLQALSSAADAVQSGGKSPVSALNELGVTVVYKDKKQSGPAHCPNFTVTVMVADLLFEGSGSSKRAARACAARACLKALLAKAGGEGGEGGEKADAVEEAEEPQGDFSEDDLGMQSEFVCSPIEIHMKPPNVQKPLPPAVAPPGPPSLFAVPLPSAHKSPINLLYESYPGIDFVCTFGDGTPLDAADAPMQLSHSMRFKVVCQIKEKRFEGYGSSKKLAKLAACRAALATLDDKPVPLPATIRHKDDLSQTLADHVAKLVNEKFNEIMRNDLVHSKRKVLAGIVITTDNKIEGARVICVTSGTKCVSGEHMSVRGMAVNDCHAEVAARRILQRHLYRQLAEYAEADDPTAAIAASDLEPLPEGGYRLKSGRSLHLYVSTAPCGDARIFSPHDQPSAQPDRHPNRLARGQLRTKIESGEGTIPVKNSTNTIQTWDGVMQGERLLTMSCSDKVAKWCVVGLQGSLLSYVLQPVYLHSVVLGSLLHPHHMYRAICGRVEGTLSALPPPFALQRPALARAASSEARSPARAPSFSVCWSSTDKSPEIVNASTGKLEGGQPALICKQTMFARWQYIMRRLTPLPQEVDFTSKIPEVPSNFENLLYSEAKQLCPSYQTAKQCLIEAFEKAKLGRWVKKPIEQDQFVCEITNDNPALLFA